MFPGSPFRAITDAAGAKLPSGPGTFGAGSAQAFGSFIKPKPRLQPQSQTLMGEDQPRQSFGGGSNVFR